MRKINVTFHLLLLFSISNFLKAQDYSIKDKRLWPSKLKEITTPESVPGMIYFDKEKEIKTKDLFTKYKDAFALRMDDEMQLERVQVDGIGITHHKFKQSYKGVPIEGAEIIVHEKEGYAYSMNGILINDLELDVTPTITYSKALSIADENTQNNVLKSNQLIITRKDDNADLDVNNVIVAYKVDIILDDINHYWIYIDAKEGAIAKKISLTKNCTVGTCQTLYNGTKPINTQWRGGIHHDYVLIDDCHGDGIHTFLGGYYNELTDKDNNWSAVEERGATSAHWATGVSWDYFYNIHGRNGTDNNNRKIHIKASYGNLLNASYGNDNEYELLIFGSGDNGVNANHFASLDIVGHEFTHGVTKHTADLYYNGESGALNESFSDIFGAMIEFYEEGGNGDYEIGENVAINPNLKRSLKNPKAYPTGLSAGSPSTYKGQYWHTEPTDNGGVHINSGVQNFWFYLLSEGGSGTNDNGESYSVTGIGKEKAAAIAYRALVYYNSLLTNYIGARNHSVMAAKDLFGECSEEAIQTANAWYAVGVGSASSFYDIHVCGVLQNDVVKSAINLLSAGSSNSCFNTTIKSSADVVFKSANQIQLLPGFSVEEGANFVAYIDPCAVATTKMQTNNSNRTNNLIESEIRSIGLQSMKDSETAQQIPEISVFPNPSAGTFTIRLDTEVSYSSVISIMDIYGKTILRETISKNSLDIDLYNHPKGVYFVAINTDDYKVVKKLILF